VSHARFAGALFVLLALSQTVQAQGLIWSLPEDGTWVRFEGTYEQTEINPDAAAGNLAIQWIRHVTIKSVGKEEAEFDGATVPCRWIEIKVVTGTASEQGINPGPVGTRILKALVPESRVTGKVEYGDGILVSYLPIVKGLQKTGDGPVQPMESNVLNIYPLLSPMMHYRTLESADADEEVDTPLGKVPARKFTGQLTIESPTIRAESTAEFWASNEVPFGLAKWSVKQTRSRKDRAETRDQFKPKSELTAEMSAHAKGNDAQSEIQTP